jgi:hypothetical protein
MQKRFSIIALTLLIPAPTLGVLAGMIFLPDHPAGKTLFFASKAWIFILPAAWRLLIEHRPISLSPATKGGFTIAALLGLAISAVLTIGYIAARPLIDPQSIRNMAQNTGLINPTIYLIGAAYWILVNSVLEEYVWRWFVVEKLETLVPSGLAVILSAAAFTLHHFIAMTVFFSLLVTAIASLGVFTGGVIWSACYVRFRSIWPGYLSHAIVDLALFVIGYVLIFG